ncbi:histidinol dehydrogenase [Flammeovirgaceae bacterium SG7u.111]|nr:histidinol dehydrogenase [Flammeovirgaceae bacterium SG7u.132]WPO36844.1 histidinol dehydrogenase [Flammeovirgaceae bacterium SG7u.111]
MQTIIHPDKKDWAELLKRPVMDLAEIEQKVAPVLSDVKENGDAALRKYSELFDKVTIEEFEVSKSEMERAEMQLDNELIAAIKRAKNNIEKFHLIQKELVKKVETMPGVLCWRKSVGIDKVGLYIPGGTAPLFSSVLMLGIPAKIAGCKEIVLCTPPGKNGKIHSAILYSAHLVGITKVFKVGGAQAVAAMAYGTESIPSVYKIFGPGNQYVTAAKQLVTKHGIAIDMPAGPSEVAIIADKQANPEFIAADLLSQAEHGIDSQVLLVTDSEAIVEPVLKAVRSQLNYLPRKEFASKALENSKIIVAKSLDETVEIINAYAPEHLIISLDFAEEVGERITNAGSVFLGHYTPESVGDYASGTNHTLPTNGYAKAFSGVSLDSYVKKITFQHISKTGMKQLGDTVETMAAAEELMGHKNAVTVRLKAIKKEE